MKKRKQTTLLLYITHELQATKEKKHLINENVGTDIDGRTPTSDQANGRQTLERKDGIEIHPEL